VHILEPCAFGDLTAGELGVVVRDRELDLQDVHRHVDQLVGTPEEFRATAVVLARCVDDGLKAASAAAGHSGGSDRLSGEALQTATTTPREAARKAIVSIHGPLRTKLG
jgi:hypothetical protein